ncbi:hypothetical protein KIPB_007462 [Kipferlia bialata]|uniref:Uncharacterized protein n=1 Tax=Kipferlia bialata TaxID=797122 RepID=A0A9K3CYU5_9EUKA|nr:hypothetical protein KIPB_007462 [Kipferlia bialata]|eukprot:g7462.t1
MSETVVSSRVGTLGVASYTVTVPHSDRVGTASKTRHCGSERADQVSCSEYVPCEESVGTWATVVVRKDVSTRHSYVVGSSWLSTQHGQDPCKVEKVCVIYTEHTKDSATRG